jgi:hypothetical protein
MAMITIKRPEARYNFPLVDRFIHTGEPLNPWRCDCCATATQRSKAVEYRQLYELGDIEYPECCRKCGLDYH